MSDINKVNGEYDQKEKNEFTLFSTKLTDPLGVFSDEQSKDLCEKPRTYTNVATPGFEKPKIEDSNNSPSSENQPKTSINSQQDQNYIDDEINKLFVFDVPSAEMIEKYTESPTAKRLDEKSQVMQQVESPEASNRILTPIPLAFDINKCDNEPLEQPNDIQPDFSLIKQRTLVPDYTNDPIRQLNTIILRPEPNTYNNEVSESYTSGTFRLPDNNTNTNSNDCFYQGMNGPSYQPQMIIETPYISPTNYQPWNNQPSSSYQPQYGYQQPPYHQPPPQQYYQQSTYNPQYQPPFQQPQSTYQTQQNYQPQYQPPLRNPNMNYQQQQSLHNSSTYPNNSIQPQQSTFNRSNTHNPSINPRNGMA